MIVCGWGVLVLAIWSVLRVVLAVIMEYQDYVGKNVLPALQEYTDDSKFLVLLTVILIIIFSMLDALIRLAICRAANAEGRGIRKKGFYLVLMVYIMLESIVNIYAYVDMFYNDKYHMMEEILAGLLLTVTELVITVDLFTSSLYVRKILKKEAKLSQNAVPVGKGENS